MAKISSIFSWLFIHPQIKHCCYGIMWLKIPTVEGMRFRLMMSHEADVLKIKYLGRTWATSLAHCWTGSGMIPSWGTSPSLCGDSLLWYFKKILPCQHLCWFLSRFSQTLPGILLKYTGRDWFSLGPVRPVGPFLDLPHALFPPKISPPGSSYLHYSDSRGL